MSIVNVIMRVRKDTDVGPNYVTICMKDHWGSDNIMITSGTWDATKFDVDDEDAKLFCDYLNNTRTDSFEVVPIDTRHLSSRRNEYWSDPHVHCNFKNDKIFRGEKL